MLSVSLGSSRANAKEGPDHPPSFKKIRIGTISLPWKNSAIFSVADGVTTIIMFSPFQKNRPACMVQAFLFGINLKHDRQLSTVANTGIPFYRRC